MEKYSNKRLSPPGGPEGLAAWYLIPLVGPLAGRLHPIGGVAPGTRPLKPPRQPTGRSGAGLKLGEPKDLPAWAGRASAEAGLAVCPKQLPTSRLATKAIAQMHRERLMKWINTVVRLVTPRGSKRKR